MNLRDGSKELFARGFYGAIIRQEGKTNVEERVDDAYGQEKGFLVSYV